MVANTVNNLLLVNLLAPDMAAKKYGSIIIMSSIAGSRGSLILGAYGITEAR